jgi:hypothetical protein
MQQKHPYVGLPDRQFWKKDAGIASGALLDPVSHVPFKISLKDRIVTAGSCFAQHVARFMSNSGFNHHITETAHPIIPQHLATKHNYGMFSARYGNIYTARQLRQLLERAYGKFTPETISWTMANSEGVIDPFRPQIQPLGFVSEAELSADRAFHFRCIRDAVESMDVFVFTLGLTEGWEDRRDKAIFPVAPGVFGGTYDPDTAQFVNFDETETYEDLRAAFDFIRRVNPSVKFVLTVSPVALNATYEDRHVLLSTTWSKAVLRIAAEKAVLAFPNTAYFPSYEIITSPHVRGAYFADDCREVTAAGVAHVMQLFIRHFTDATGQMSEASGATPLVPDAQKHLLEMQEKIDALCDEAALDNK